MATLCKCRARFSLHTYLTLSDVVKVGEGAVYVSEDVIPGLAMEDRIAPGCVSNHDPIDKLTYLLARTIRVRRYDWGGLEADGYHIVVIAMIDVGLLVAPQSLFQIFQRLSLIYVRRLAFAMQLETDT